MVRSVKKRMVSHQEGFPELTRIALIHRDRKNDRRMQNRSKKSLIESDGDCDQRVMAKCDESSAVCGGCRRTVKKQMSSGTSNPEKTV